MFFLQRLVLVATWLSYTNAFLVPTTQQQPRSISAFGRRSSFASSSSLSATYDPYGGRSRSSGGDALDRNRARTDLRSFLTQRSIQSFVFLLNQCKEGHTVRWLENKLDFKKIDSFHGTGAFNITLFPEWDSLLLDLATQDPETVILEVTTQKKTRRGWGYHASYVNNIGTTTSSSREPSATAPTAPWAALANGQNQASSSQESPQTNYMANKNSVVSWKTPPSSSTASISNDSDDSVTAAPQKSSAPRGMGAQGNYMDALSRSPQPQTPPKLEVAAAEEKPAVLSSRRKGNKRSGRKTRKEREMIQMQKKMMMVVEQEKKDKEVASSSLSSTQTTTTTNKLVGSHGGYLETLLSNTIEGSSSKFSSEQRNENPHIEEKTIEYEFDIDPPSLVTRIITVREQISKEWKEDLDIVVRTNDRILDEYEENQRLAEEEDDDEDESDEDDQEAPVLESNVATPCQTSQEGKNLLYDRNAMSYLTNSIASQDRASSPLRRSNLDLLLLLCTQESIHRVLREYQEDMDSGDSTMHMEKFEWLQSFYKENVKKYFDGHEHSFGRADKFLEALMVQPAVAREKRNGGIYLIDPIAITEDILRERSMVAREWKSIVATIPDEHLDLRRILFSRHLMEVTDWKIGGIGSNSLHIEESPLMKVTPESGAFE